MSSRLSKLLGVNTLLVNSGLAQIFWHQLLYLHLLDHKKRLNPGDEVITVAAGFPTTVAPIIQNSAVPVFVDSNPVTGNICEDLEKAYDPNKTKAVILAHTLGNPLTQQKFLSFAESMDLVDRG